MSLLDKAQASEQFEHLLGQLHILIDAGQGDSAEADNVREEMEIVWLTLSREERQHFEQRSADLNTEREALGFKPHKYAATADISVSQTSVGTSMFHLIWYVLVGSLAGLIWNAVVPGVHHLGFIATVLLGIIGSIVGGFTTQLFSKPDVESLSPRLAGLIFSILGAVLVLFVSLKLHIGG